MMIFIEVRLPRLKKTSWGFPNPLFGNLLLSEDQTIHNLLLTNEDQTVSTNNFLYTIILSQRVVVYNLLTLIVYQRFDKNGSRSIWKNLIFNQGFEWYENKLEKWEIDVKDVFFFSFSMDFSCMLLFSLLLYLLELRKSGIYSQNIISSRYGGWLAFLWIYTNPVTWILMQSLGSK